MKSFPPNSDILNSERQKADKDWDGERQELNMLYLKPGVTQIRILPPYSEKGLWFREVMEHTLQTSEGRWVSVTCPGMEGEACALCDKGLELMAEGTEEKAKAGNQLKPRYQYLFNTVCFSSPIEGPNAPKVNHVSVMKAGKSVFRQILQLDQDEAMGWCDITNAEKGINLTIKRSGKGLETKYQVNVHGGRTNLKESLEAQGVDLGSLEQVDLDSLFPHRSYEELQDLADNGRLASRGGGGFIGGGLKVETPEVAPPETPTAPVVDGTPVPEIPGLG